MSVLSVVPELVGSAAGDLAGIGSTLETASSAAAVSTVGVMAPAADSVSARVAELFGQHAVSYQAVSAQGQVFHQDFVSKFSASATSYTDADRTSTSVLGKGQGQGVRLLGSRQHQTQGVASRLWRPGMTGPRLIVPQHKGLHLPNGYQRGGVPHLGGMNMLGLGKGGTATGGGFTGIRQIIANQISYLKLIATSLEDFVKDELKAIVGLPAAFEQAVKDLLHGNIKGSMSDIEKGFLKFFVNGMQWTGETYHFDRPNIDWYEGEFTGPMADLWHMMQIPANEMQNLADALKPLGFGFTGKLVQHLADPLNELANGWHIYCRNGTYAPGFTMGAPLAKLFDLLGAPILSMEAFEDSIQATFDDLLSGHLLKAGFDFLTTPASMLHAFLFGQGFLHLPAFYSPGGHAYAGAVHLGGIFAPLDYGLEYLETAYDWAQVGAGYGTLTGGLIPALVSTLPPILQDPLLRLGWFLDAIIARLTGHSSRP